VHNIVHLVAQHVSKNIVSGRYEQTPTRFDKMFPNSISWLTILKTVKEVILCVRRCDR
jgi:hypothetical protein